MAIFCHMLGYYTQSQLIIAVSVLSSSFLGSLHCLGMCGPIVVATNKTKWHSLFYQMGRLFGYLILGFIVGHLGQEILGRFPGSWAALIAPFILGLTFISLGLLLFKQRQFHFPLPKLISLPYKKFITLQSKNKSSVFTFFIGLCSIFLPCGWLYGFVIGAATTNSIKTSLLIMFMFWLGTVPALFFTPLIFQKIIGPLKKKFPAMAGSILLVAGAILILVAIRRVL